VFEERQPRSETRISVEAPESASVARVVVFGVGDAGHTALQRFFIALEEGCGMTFVIVQHRPQASQSSATAVSEALQQLTDLPVHDLDPQVRVDLAPDQVFVAAPGWQVEFSSGRLRATQPTEAGVLDATFGSLARVHGARGVGIVLPGSGRDGEWGVQAIADNGGTTYATPPPDAAPFDMTAIAIATGRVTHVLSPFQIAQELTEPEPLEWPAASANTTPTSSGAAPATREELERDHAALLRANRELIAAHSLLHSQVSELSTELQEAHARNAALLQAQCELSGLVGGTSLALVLLDEKLRVQGYSGDLQELYEITPKDIGKPLSELPHRAHQMPALPSMHSLLHGTQPAEADVVTPERWYLRRVLVREPAKAARRTRVMSLTDPIRLVVLFIDVTKLKDSEAAAQPHDDWVRTITDGSPSLISYVDEAIAHKLPPGASTGSRRTESA